VVHEHPNRLQVLTVFQEGRGKGVPQGMRTNSPCWQPGSGCTPLDHIADGLLSQAPAPDRDEHGAAVRPTPTSLQIRPEEGDNPIAQWERLYVPAFAEETDPLCPDIQVLQIHTNQFTDSGARPQKRCEDCLIPAYDERVGVARRPTKERRVLVGLQIARFGVCHLWPRDPLRGIPADQPFAVEVTEECPDGNKPLGSGGRAVPLSIPGGCQVIEELMDHFRGHVARQQPFTLPYLHELDEFLQVIAIGFNGLWTETPLRLDVVEESSC
jgi:hypothetical protein